MLQLFSDPSINHWYFCKNLKILATLLQYFLFFYDFITKSVQKYPTFLADLSSTQNVGMSHKIAILWSFLLVTFWSGHDHCNKSLVVNCNHDVTSKLTGGHPERVKEHHKMT